MSSKGTEEVKVTLERVFVSASLDQESGYLGTYEFEFSMQPQLPPFLCAVRYGDGEEIPIVHIYSSAILEASRVIQGLLQKVADG